MIQSHNSLAQTVGLGNNDSNENKNAFLKKKRSTPRIAIAV